MAIYRHLTKSEELSHGEKVQNMLGAKDEITLLNVLEAGEKTYKDVNLISHDDDKKESIYSLNFARVNSVKKPGLKTKKSEILVSGGSEGSSESCLILNTNPERRAFLAKTIRIGEKSTDALTKSNLGLVYNQAKKFKRAFPSAPELEDLIQEGMTGLVTAIFKYDPIRGNKLSTVATPWIYQAISRGTNKTGRLVKLPENRITNYLDMLDIIKKYEEFDLSSNEMNEIIMDELGLTQEDITSIMNAANIPLSLNYKVGSEDEGDASELIDLIGDINASESSEDTVIKTEISNSLSMSLEGLNELEKDVVSASFGLVLNDDGKRLTARDVREKHSISLQKLKKTLDQALTKMKSDLGTSGMDYSDFDEQQL